MVGLDVVGVLGVFVCGVRMVCMWFDGLVEVVFFVLFEVV